jgi:hypothetical protein
MLSTAIYQTDRFFDVTDGKCEPWTIAATLTKGLGRWQQSRWQMRAEMI